jgi:hypothetical protein
MVRGQLAVIEIGAMRAGVVIGANGYVSVVLRSDGSVFTGGVNEALFKKCHLHAFQFGALHQPQRPCEISSFREPVFCDEVLCFI